MTDTLGSMRAEVLGWLRGDYSSVDDINLVNASLNDAIQTVWRAMMEVQLSRFFGLDSPVTFTFAAGSERVQLVTIVDPSVAPVIGSQAGGAFGNRSVLGGYTYVTESGSETQLSPTTAQAIGANNLGVVTAPTPQQYAYGWNFYCSPSNTAALLALQNQQPLPFKIAYNEPPVGWLDYPGAQQGPPQAQGATTPTPQQSPPPSENTTADNIAYITHLEIRNSDTLLRSWNQYGVDSDIFRRYGRTRSNASEYETYVWDLINGNRLEIRPTAGLTFNPRYFYIAKPRRLRYDQAEVPYVSISGVHQYIIEDTISKLKLGVDEYLAHQAWETKADKTKLDIRQALAQELWSREIRVAPFMW